MVQSIIPYTVVVLEIGDNYGLNNSLIVEKEPLVEFYDRRYMHTPYGQFTGARYRLSTLLEKSNTNYGLCLDGGVPAWVIDANTFKIILSWLQLVATLLTKATNK